LFGRELNGTAKRFAVGWRYSHDLIAGRLQQAADKIRDVPGLQGAAMIRILNDFLMFTCATMLVTGIVLAAATLLI
jgi:hypothetical protein